MCRYDRLLKGVKGSGEVSPGMCVVGVSVMGEEVMRGVVAEYQRGRVRKGVRERVSKSVFI